MKEVIKIDDNRGNRVVIGNNPEEMHDLVTNLCGTVGYDNIHIEFNGTGFKHGEPVTLLSNPIGSYNLQFNYFRQPEGVNITDFRGTFDVFWKEVN